MLGDIRHQGKQIKNHLIYFLLFLKDAFAYFEDFRKGKRHRKFFYSILHSTNSYSGQHWARLNPRA